MSATVKVDICQLPHGEGLALPAYQSADAAGLDLLAAVPADTPLILPPGKYAMVPTGLTIALPPGYEAQVRPRSGLAAKHGVTVLNSPGTMDADYRGEISYSDQPWRSAVPDPARRAHCADGDRAGGAGALVAVTSLSATDRGSGGFGSTGRSSNSIKHPGIILQIAFDSSASTFFTAELRSRSGLLPANSPKGILSTQFVHGGVSAGPAVVRFWGKLFGRSRGDASKPAVVHLTGAPRPDCARHRLVGISGTALAGDLTITQAISAWLDLNHQEFAALTTALALVGFTVVAAIL